MRKYSEQYQYESPGATPEAENETVPERIPLRLRVNGKPYSLYVDPRRTLLDALRNDCGLTGAKKTCDMGNCGACTVLLDGRAVYSCLVLAVECVGHEIDTVEGLAAGGELDALQTAFMEHDAFQCGYCTAGQLMSLKALFNVDPVPDSESIARAVSGNLCRCGAYRHIVNAAEAVAEQNRKGSSGS